MQEAGSVFHKAKSLLKYRHSNSNSHHHKICTSQAVQLYEVAKTDVDNKNRKNKTKKVKTMKETRLNYQNIDGNRQVDCNFCFCTM